MMGIGRGYRKAIAGPCGPPLRPCLWAARMQLASLKLGALSSMPIIIIIAWWGGARRWY